METMGVTQIESCCVSAPGGPCVLKIKENFWMTWPSMPRVGNSAANEKNKKGVTIARNAFFITAKFW
jgi:hypothetical protein